MEDGLPKWAFRPPKLLPRPRNVEPLPVASTTASTRQAMVQRTMPGSVRQSETEKPTPVTLEHASSILLCYELAIDETMGFKNRFIGQ